MTSVRDVTTSRPSTPVSSCGRLTPLLHHSVLVTSRSADDAEGVVVQPRRPTRTPPLTLTPSTRISRLSGRASSILQEMDFGGGGGFSATTAQSERLTESLERCHHIRLDDQRKKVVVECKSVPPAPMGSDYSYVHFSMSPPTPGHEYSDPVTLEPTLATTAAATVSSSSSSSFRQDSVHQITPTRHYHVTIVPRGGGGGGSGGAPSRRESLTSLRLHGVETTVQRANQSAPSLTPNVASLSSHSSSSTTKQPKRQQQQQQQHRSRLKGPPGGSSASRTPSQPVVQQLLGARSRSAVSARCVYCRATYDPDDNPHGGCLDAPDRSTRCIDLASCSWCMRGMICRCFPHDETADCAAGIEHPCACTDASTTTTSRSRRRKWLALAALSLVLPCMWCYWPLTACHRCGVRCGCCGGQHHDVYVTTTTTTTTTSATT